MATDEQNRLLSNTYDFYQEVTKNLNSYYYEMKNIVCIKFIKIKSGDFILEVHILNDEFENPLRINGLSNEQGRSMITNITRDINKLVDLFKAYNNDISKQKLNQISKEYVANLTNACVRSIERYEVCTLAISDLSKPEHELNFVLIGNVTDKELKKDMTLSKLNLRYTLKQLFPNNTKSFIQSLVKKYAIIFVELCIVTDKNNKVYYH